MRRIKEEGGGVLGGGEEQKTEEEEEGGRGEEGGRERTREKERRRRRKGRLAALSYDSQYEAWVEDRTRKEGGGRVGEQTEERARSLRT